MSDGTVVSNRGPVTPAIRGRAKRNEVGHE